MNQHKVNIDNACLTSKEQCKPLMDVGNLADLFFKLYPKPEENILSSDFKKLVQNIHSPITSAEPNNDEGDVAKIPTLVHSSVQQPTTSALSKNLLGGGLNMVATERNSDNDNESGSMIQLPAKKGGTLKIKNLNEGVAAGLMTNPVNDNNMTMPLALIDPSINLKKSNSVTLTSTPPNVGIAKSSELLKKTLNSNETAANLKTTNFTPTKLFCSTVTSEMVNNSEKSTAAAVMATTPKPGEVAMPTGGLLICPSTTYTVQSVLNSKVSLGISSPTLTNPVRTVLTSSAQQLLSNNITPSTIAITTTPTPTNSTNSTASNSPAIRPVPLSHLTNPQTVAFAAALQKHLQAQEMLRYTDAILNRQTAGRILETMLLNHQQENTCAGGGGGGESLPSNDNNENESFKEDEEDLNNGSDLTNDDSQMTSFDDIHLMENVLEAAKNLPQLPPNAINLMPSTSANGSGSNCSTLYSLTDESRKYLNLAVQRQAQAEVQVPNLQVRENFLDLSINAVAAAAAAAQASSTSRSRARNRTDSQTEDGGDLQKYVCSFCGKMYRWKSTLRRHINVECGGKLPLNTCPYCPYKSRQAGNLGVHVRKHHPDKEPLASKRRSKYSRLATRSPSAHTSSNPPTPPTNSNGDATSEDSGILSNESSK